MLDENLSVENQEVAEPEIESTEDLGVEEQEVAEPGSPEGETGKKTDTDSAFAEMRRAREAAEREALQAREELEQLRAAQKARQDALERLTGKENADIEALADSLGLEVSDVIATLDAEQQTASLRLENERLSKQLEEAQTERALDNALAELNALDNNLKENDISKILSYVDKGLSVEDSYYAVKAREINTRPISAKEIGGIHDKDVGEKEYYSEKEVDAMTPEQQRANYEAILRSMSRWK